MRFYAATGLIKENKSGGWRCVTFSDFSTSMDHSCSLLEQFSSYIILTHSSTLRREPSICGVSSYRHDLASRNCRGRGGAGKPRSSWSGHMRAQTFWMDGIG